MARRNKAPASTSGVVGKASSSKAASNSGKAKSVGGKAKSEGGQKKAEKKVMKELGQDQRFVIPPQPHWSEIEELDDGRKLVNGVLVEKPADVDEVVKDGKKFWVAAPNNCVSGEFSGPGRDVERFGEAKPFPKDEYVLVPEPLLNRCDGGWIRDEPATFFENHGWCQRMEWISGGTISATKAYDPNRHFPDFAPVWFPVSRIQKFNINYRELPIKTKKGVELRANSNLWTPNVISKLKASSIVPYYSDKLRKHFVFLRRAPGENAVWAYELNVSKEIVGERYDLALLYIENMPTRTDTLVENLEADQARYIRARRLASQEKKKNRKILTIANRAGQGLAALPGHVKRRIDLSMPSIFATSNLERGLLDMCEQSDLQAQPSDRGKKRPLDPIQRLLASIPAHKRARTYEPVAWSEMVKVDQEVDTIEADGKVMWLKERVGQLLEELDTRNEHICKMEAAFLWQENASSVGLEANVNAQAKLELSQAQLELSRSQLGRQVETMEDQVRRLSRCGAGFWELQQDSNTHTQQLERLAVLFQGMMQAMERTTKLKAAITKEPLPVQPVEIDFNEAESSLIQTEPPKPLEEQYGVKVVTVGETSDFLLPHEAAALARAPEQVATPETKPKPKAPAPDPQPVSHPKPKGKKVDSAPNAPTAPKVAEPKVATKDQRADKDASPARPVGQISLEGVMSHPFFSTQKYNQYRKLFEHYSTISILPNEEAGVRMMYLYGKNLSYLEKEMGGPMHLVQEQRKHNDLLSDGKLAPVDAPLFKAYDNDTPTKTSLDNAKEALIGLGMEISGTKQKHSGAKVDTKKKGKEGKKDKSTEKKAKTEKVRERPSKCSLELDLKAKKKSAKKTPKLKSESSGEPDYRSIPGQFEADPEDWAQKKASWMAIFPQDLVEKSEKRMRNTTALMNGPAVNRTKYFVKLLMWAIYERKLLPNQFPDYDSFLTSCRRLQYLLTKLAGESNTIVKTKKTCKMFPWFLAAVCVTHDRTKDGFGTDEEKQKNYAAVIVAVNSHLNSNRSKEKNAAASTSKAQDKENTVEKKQKKGPKGKKHSDGKSDAKAKGSKSTKSSKAKPKPSARPRARVALSSDSSDDSDSETEPKPVNKKKSTKRKAPKSKAVVSSDDSDSDDDIPHSSRARNPFVLDEALEDKRSHISHSKSQRNNTDESSSEEEPEESSGEGSTGEESDGEGSRDDPEDSSSDGKESASGSGEDEEEEDSD